MIPGTGDNILSYWKKYISESDFTLSFDGKYSGMRSYPETSQTSMYLIVKIY